jgi:biopolymer transport protein ExbD
VKFRRQRRDELSINLTPLIDVVFLLLIFFMVSTSFTRATQLAVNLPEAEGQPAPERTAKLELVIAADGVFTLNGREISSQPIDVRRALRDESNGNRDMPITIAADGAAAHRHVVTALDAASALGFHQLTIAAQAPVDKE